MIWSTSIKTLIRNSLLTVYLSVAALVVWAQSSDENSDLRNLSPISEEVLLLSSYVNIPSETGHENLAADFFRKICEEKGLKVETITNTIGSVNFAASIYPLSQKKPNIIFLNHIDVVPADDSTEWAHHPFRATYVDGKVFGRGAIDNKGLAVTQLEAISRFVQKADDFEFPYNVTLLSVSGEEAGGTTGSAVVAQRFKETFNPAVVIGEGGSGMDNINFLSPGKSYFGISVAEKGFIWLKLACKISTDGHASVVGDDYAAKRLIKSLYRLSNKRPPLQTDEQTRHMFRQLGKSAGGLKGFVIGHINWCIFRPFLKYQIRRHPELESVFCNKITISNLMDNGGSPNQIPQEAFALVDCRYLPGSQPEEIIETVKRIVKDPDIQISVVKQGARQYATTPEFFYDELAKSIQKIFPNARVVPILFPASNDNSYFRASGTPVYGLNPMILSTEQIRSIHNKDEYIDVEDIEKGTLVFENFLQSVLFPRPTIDSALVKRQQ